MWSDLHKVSLLFALCAIFCFRPTMTRSRTFHQNQFSFSFSLFGWRDCVYLRVIRIFFECSLSVHSSPYCHCLFHFHIFRSFIVIKLTMIISLLIQKFYIFFSSSLHFSPQKYRMCTIFFSDVTSFVAALLFAVHPIHIEAVSVFKSLVQIRREKNKLQYS